jgi:hypothetical protein
VELEEFVLAVYMLGHNLTNIFSAFLYTPFFVLTVLTKTSTREAQVIIKDAHEYGGNLLDLIKMYGKFAEKRCLVN